MKHLLTFFLCSVFTIAANGQFQFISPKPGSEMITVNHNIIIREGSALDAASLHPGLFSIRGNKSGDHDFKLILCNDGKTINLNPVIPFSHDEIVSVTIAEGIQTTDRRIAEAFSFTFKTHREYFAAELQRFRELKHEMIREEMKQLNNTSSDEEELRDVTGLFTIPINTSPSPGDIFFDSWSGYFLPTDFAGYHVVSVDGDSIFSKEVGFSTNFGVKQNGYLGVYNGDHGRFDVLDSNFNIIDKYYGENGYSPDEHELLLLPNRNVLVICDEFQVVDMTVYNPNYDDDCTVNGAVIQEFDPDHNLIFEWRSFDHVDILEVLHTNLFGSFIDYVHTNSLEIDYDGNIIASHRHLDQVTKIDRNTAEFIWRLGGIENDFTWINEPQPFTFQHDVRRIANGNLTVFDNGNYHAPPHSSAKEYSIDEVNKTATLIWKYSHPNPNGGNPLYYGAMGSVQRLSNGNTFINWGWRGSTQNPSMTEVTTDGTIVWELKLAPSKNIIGYRARKMEWDPCARPTYKKMKNDEITTTTVKLKWEEVTGAVLYKVQWKKHSEQTWSTHTTNAPTHKWNKHNLDPDTKYDWRIETWCDANGTKRSGYTDIKKFTTLTLKQVQTEESVFSSPEVYPNPSAGVLNIKSGYAISSVQVTNVIGQVVKEVSAGDDTDIQINLAGIPSGTYLLTVFGINQREVTRVVVEK